MCGSITRIESNRDSLPSGLERLIQTATGALSVRATWKRGYPQDLAVDQLGHEFRREMDNETGRASLAQSLQGGNGMLSNPHRAPVC
ncbi:hypothetical protein BN2475_90027 [Paraburkholderia ribeironis]|uniref:Uncharacterized protein n=1 Tax=Paraburkholderia ribeironis TaxID=1247936 RepID=A0A1N7RMW9_9BURK|nr:hypothetical protein BN2475_90027 [Paraburkholderia ribeironis]